jgi:hypothetical protein
MNRLLTFSYNQFYGHSETDGIGGALVYCLNCNDQIGCAPLPCEMIHKWRNFYCGECQKIFVKNKDMYKRSVSRIRKTNADHPRLLNKESLYHYRAFRSAILDKTREFRKERTKDNKEIISYITKILLTHILPVRANLFRVTHPDEYKMSHKKYNLQNNE